MNLTVRPLALWPYPEATKRADVFKATCGATLELLERELRQLKGSEAIVGLVVDEGSIRMDGRLYERAKVRHPGVELSFEVPARGMPGGRPNPEAGRRLVFHTDAYRGYADSWQSNLRAIALGLEALRAVDRYGITSTAEQYAGFLQLETSQASPERGRALVEEAGSLRKALMANHPDQGGDPRAFADVQAYRQLTTGGGS